MLTILALGFSSGLPISLVGSTLQAWMATEKVDLSLISVFSLVGLPYTLKFVWAPLMDRYVPPFLGRRRGWMLVTQLALALCIALTAFCNPKLYPGLMASVAVLVAFFGASQDIVVDAFRTDTLHAEEFGAGAATATLGYRLGMLFSGAMALILADRISWQSVYLIMACAMVVGVVGTFVLPEPDSSKIAPKSLVDAVVLPFVDFFKRPGAIELTLFVIIYKLDTVVAQALQTVFMMGLGFTKTDIGAVTKGFGLIATITGTIVGGAWMVKLGIRKALWIFGILQAIPGICYYSLSLLGHHYPVMVATIASENFFSGMGNAAYSAFLMSLCNPKFTATQFALLTSLMALTRTVAGAPTGFLAESVGWPNYFLISMLLAVPGLALLTRYPVWMKKKAEHLS